MFGNGNRKRWIGWVLGVVVLVVVLVGLAGRDQMPTVAVATVSRETLDASITSNGKVEPIQPYSVRAQFDTFVARVAATEGQQVRRGQLIVTLDAGDARAQLAQAQADLIAAQQDLRAARAGGPADQVAQLEGDLRTRQAEVAAQQQTVAALTKLVEQKAATPAELDQARLTLLQKQTDLQTIQQKLDNLRQQAGTNVEKDTLRIQRANDLIATLGARVRSADVSAPADGTLFSLPVRAGDYVHTGDLIAEMADLHQVRVRAFVDEPDLGWLEPGQMVEITWDALPSREWVGRTEQVPKQVVSRGTRSVGEVLCSVDNSKLELLPNVNVDVRIRVRQRMGALVVPRAAVRTDGTKRYVFVVATGGRLHRREIQVGIASATNYEVLSGLSEGERVALPGDLPLVDGGEVRVAEGS